MFDIGRVKIDDIVDTLLWDALKKGLDGVTVRIDKGKTASVTHILESEVLEEDRLTHTGLTDDIHMATTIFFLEIDRFFVTAEFVSTKE